eukprot:scaffold9265_cov101-Isochrysis_galbana.AAC.3
MAVARGNTFRTGGGSAPHGAGAASAESLPGAAPGVSAGGESDPGTEACAVSGRGTLFNPVPNWPSPPPPPASARPLSHSHVSSSSHSHSGSKAL